ncbi:MAG TPA: hypothetical protein VH234_05060 [Candidatus Saccharimonadales bacterium]|jgi:hypothetical protein|nr:hypothetical protein [Candidatus Saccharimonadales bacterium]
MKHSIKFKKSRALARAVGVVGVVALAVGGVTFAALQSQQNVLTGNSIETSTVGMSISTDGQGYSQSRPGFSFASIIPGGAPAPTTGLGFYIRNDGAVPLALKMSVISTPSNPSNVDLSKVNLIVTAASGGPVQSFSLQSLMSNGGQALTVPLPSGAGGQVYRMQVSMAADAFTGQSASLGNIDVAFNGTAISS